MIKKFLGKALLVLLVGGIVVWMGSDDQAVPTVVNGVGNLFTWSGSIIEGIVGGLSGLGDQGGSR